ncbi:MAG: hypothetical protein QY303_10425 [Vicingaceae bacterium]|nr:MAG: hypothetical protein QY303_10425 [Vicingaceae bacterium]
MNNAIKSLAEKDWERILLPQKIEESTQVLPITITSKGDTNGDDEDFLYTTLWLHLKLKKTCYYFHSIYDYKSKVTSDKKGKNRVKVDKIKLNIYKDLTRESYTISKKNSSKFNFTDRITGSTQTCGMTECTATASKEGYGSWSVVVRLD